VVTGPLEGSHAFQEVQSYGRNLWMSPWHERAAYLPP
jgi:hypothetical protein